MDALNRLSQAPPHQIAIAPLSPIYAQKQQKNEGLGTITKSCSIVDLKGKIYDKDKAREYRKSTTQLKERAGEILYVPNQKKQHRVCACGKCRIDGTAPVSVRYNATKEMASYSNLQWCGSVWLCPDCSYRITQERKKELSDAMKACRDKRLHVSMLTLTVPHYLGDDLRTLLKKMSKAKHALWTNRNSSGYFAENFPMVGHITATEVKYSDNNGWHPHYHILIFTEIKYDQEDIDLIQDELYDLWAEKCVKVGLGKPSKAHGLNLKVGSKDEILADYISKWGLAEEMTQAHQKIGKKNRQSLTPWEILDLSRMEASTKDKYGHLFSVYASAFKGRRQLFWSKGLKELLKVADKSDEQLANEHSQDEPQDEVFEDMISLSEQDWWAICFHRLRVEFLELVETDIKANGINTDFKAIKELLWNLKYPSDPLGSFGVEGCPLTHDL